MHVKKLVMKATDGSQIRCRANLSLGRLDFDLLDKDHVWFHHHNHRCIGGLCDTTQESRVIVYFGPLNQRLTA